MKKSITVTLVVIISIVLTAGLGVLGWVVATTPFTVDKYLEEVAEGTNLTMEYKWNLIGQVTRDIYEFDDGNMRRLGGVFEMVTSLNSEGNYDTYTQIYNVWFKDRTVNEKTYLNAIGFGENGGGLGDEFGSTKQEGIVRASAVLDLARESLDEAFEMDTDKFVLKEEFYADVFGSKFENYGDILVEISLDRGEVVLNMEYGSHSFVLTISDLGRTKVKITDEMKNADEKFVVYGK